VELFSPHPLFSVEFITGMWFLSFVAASDTQPEPNNMTTQIKFGFRKGNQKRGKIITGVTVQEYLKSIGSEDECITPNGGWFRIGESTISFAITIY
jgi:hypothetical protein